MSKALAHQLEQTILAHRIMPVDVAWDGEIVFPYYDGLSICNLAPTVVGLLDTRAPASALACPPLDRRLWAHLQGQIKRVVLFLSDGLGWRLLQEIAAEDATIAQALADLTGDGTLTPITSIAPSTTAAALPSIWAGAPPAATGMLGTRLFLREFSTLVNMLHYVPMNGRHRPDALEDWGLDMETFMPLTTLGETLRHRRIPSHLLLQKDLLGSGLSRIMHRGIQHTTRHFGYTDMWIGLRDLLHQTRGKRCFVTVYWGAVDGVSHLYGTVTEQSITEIRRQLCDLRDVVLGAESGDRRTLFMLAADHGHTPVPDHVNVSDHPPLAEALRCGLGGEGRFTHMYLRHDYRQQAVEYVRDHFADRLACLNPSDALCAGLYGTQPPHPETGARLGDLTLIARAGWHVGARAPSSWGSVSRHGGLSDREMLVPLLMRVV
jgi:hypothetical protein